METRLHLIVVWFHWKLCTKKEGNCSGRSRVRRILLTCIQLLLLQFLHVIWSVPTNFAFFKKPPDKFFYKFENSEINARAYETWKQCQWIMRTLTCKHKIWGKNWSYLRPYLKAFLVFNVLETCRVYLLTIDLEIVKFIKKFIERFF